MIAPDFVAIGVGCRSGCPGSVIASLAAKVLAEAGGGAAALFTSVDKQSEPGIAAAAMQLGLPLVYLPRAALQEASPGAQTRSQRVVELFGVPSVAETAALAGAGQGATLVVRRQSAAGASCAAARPAGAPQP